MSGLILRAVEVDGRSRWRWDLSRERGGEPLAKHVVRVDPNAPGWTATGSDPEVRRWIIDEVLGHRIARLIADPKVDRVHLRVPQEAAFLVELPLSLAGRSYRPPVVFTYELTLPVGTKPSRPADGLRILALSMTADGPSQAVRRDLGRLAEVTAHCGRGIDLVQLPSRVDRGELHQAADAYAGWDVLHLSTDGAAGAVILDDGFGYPDRVSGLELLRLLRPMRGRLRLMVISVCRSDHRDVADTMRWLGEDPPELPSSHQEYEGGGVARLALQAAVQLGTTVVATRFPADGRFVARMYERLLSGQSLLEAVKPRTGDGDPAAHPVIVGADLDVRLGLPDDAPESAVEPVGERGVPSGLSARPVRFVGRDRELSLAAAVLASESSSSGLLFVGAGGSGKTACVQEAAHQFGNRFTQIVWWSADGTASALTSLAFALETAVRVPLVQALAADDLERVLPLLRSTLCHSPMLLVLDNLESALDGDGNWRDHRLGRLMRTLTGHGGMSRALMTSRVRPRDLFGQVAVAEIEPLSLPDMVELARQLPNLARLLDSVDPAGERRRLSRLLFEVTSGHPRMLELVDAAATNPDGLAAGLAAIDQDDPRLRLGQLFPHRAAGDESAEFRIALAGWATLVLAGLSPAAERLLHLLVLLDADDRVERVVAAAWSRLSDGMPIDEPLDALVRLGLMVEPDGTSAVYRLHDGVPGAVRASIPPAIRTEVDEALALAWHPENADTLDPESALRGVPYQIRVKRWAYALELLRLVDERDHTPGTTGRVLDHLAAMLAMVSDPSDRLAIEVAQARIHVRMEPTEGPGRLLELLARAGRQDEPTLASTVAGELARVLLERGDTDGALRWATHKMRFTRSADLGPAALALDECQRLQIRLATGDGEPVFTRAIALARELRGSLSTDPPRFRRALEVALQTARRASIAIGSWESAVVCNREVLDSLRARRAGDHEWAWVGFNHYTTLLNLGRPEEARSLLNECQAIFERTSDARALGAVYSARAELALISGSGETAHEMEWVALRLKYFTADPDEVAASHHNLAGYLLAAPAERRNAFAHRIAAAVLLRITRREQFRKTLGALANDLHQYGDKHVPTSLDACVTRVEAVDGVQFAELLQALEPDRTRQWEIFDRTLFDARRIPGGPAEVTLPTLLGES